MKKIFLALLVLGQISYGQNAFKKDSTNIKLLEVIVV